MPKRLPKLPPEWWNNYEYPVKKTKHNRPDYYKCNVPGCNLEERKLWSGVNKHLESHGKPKPQPQLPKVECEYCKDCVCCNGGQGNAYQCTKGYMRAHWWKKGKHKCMHPPDKPVKALQGFDSDEEEENSNNDSEGPVNDFSTSQVDATKLSDAKGEQDDSSPSERGGGDTYIVTPRRTAAESSESNTDTAAVVSAEKQTGAPTLEQIRAEHTKYVHELRDAHNVAKARLRKLVQAARTENNKTKGHVRFTSETFVFLKLFEECEVNEPLLLDEYLAGKQDGTITPESRIFLFLSADQARMLLSDGRPRVTVLVPAALDPGARQRMDLHKTLDKLECFDTINYHDYRSETVDDVYATVGSASEVMSLFRQAMRGESKPVINVLDIGITTTRPTPSFLNDLPGWDLIDHRRKSNDVGDAALCNNVDLSKGDFHLLATNGATSLAHMDSGGAVTYGRAEYGDKLWLSWPTRSTGDLQRWAWCGRPSGPPFQMYIRPGDQFVQPAGTPHAVLTGPKHRISLLAGRMFMPSQNIAEQTRCMVAEAWSRSWITNEDEAKETASWLDDVKTLMAVDNPAFPWPEKEEKAQFTQHYDEWKNWSKMGGMWSRGCSCTDCKASRNCGCRKRGQLCNPRCHDKGLWPDHNHAAQDDCRPFPIPFMSEKIEMDAAENDEDDFADDEKMADALVYPLLQEETKGDEVEEDEFPWADVLQDFQTGGYEDFLG